MLVIDADPQGNLSQSLGIENPDELEIALPSIMEQIIMDKDVDVIKGIIHHEEGVDLMPCNIDLSGVRFTGTQSMWANVFFVVTDCALVAIIFYDNRNRQQSHKIIGMTMWIIPIITSVIYLIIAISAIVFTIWTLFWGSIQIRCNDRDFNIEAKGWNDYTGEYSQIDSISYEVNVLQNDNDYRTNGFGNLKYAMGNFKNDIFRDYIRYTHASCHSYVVMNIDGKILVVNGENDAETKEIYQRISEKVSKERK